MLRFPALFQVRAPDLGGMRTDEEESEISLGSANN
jgi:hypothetical protein